MPEPTVTDVHVNRPMTNLSIAYMNAPYMYVARRVFPGLSVAKRSDKIFAYDQGDFLRDDATPRAPGALYPEGGYAITSDDEYACVDYAWAKDVPDEVRANSDDPLRPDADAMLYLTEKFKLAHERRVAAIATNVAVITNNKDLAGAGNYQWSDYANSDPVGEVYVGHRTIRRAVQKHATRLLLAAEVFEDGLGNHPDILDRIKYTERGSIQAVINALAGIFWVDEVLMGGAVYNSAAKGAVDVFADIWTDHALLFFVPPSPSLMSPALGYTFEWMGGVQIRTTRDDLRDRDLHKGKHIADEKLLVADCGYLFDNAT